MCHSLLQTIAVLAQCGSKASRNGTRKAGSEVANLFKRQTGPEKSENVGVWSYFKRLENVVVCSNMHAHGSRQE